MHDTFFEKSAEGVVFYGFNGQMKDDEVYDADGTLYTAEYWQYDSHLRRRWNLDPKPQVGISDYACFGNNCILYNDLFGDKFKIGVKDEKAKSDVRSMAKEKTVII